MDFIFLTNDLLLGIWTSFRQDKNLKQKKYTLLQSKFVSRQNSLFQKLKEKFGGKKVYFANE
jgi:hypothetical protein